MPDETQMPARTADAHRSWLILAAIAAVILAQAVLVFAKSINWDEFLHFSQVYDLPRGRVIWAIQTLHARLFAWARWVPGDVIAQLEAARLGMLVFETVTAWMIVLSSRLFVDRQIALLAGLAYVAGGYVFLHGFSFRPDPMAAATLLTALYLFARRDLSPPNILLTGILIGVAGVMTIKSIFYLPCFAGVAWYRFAERTEGTRSTLARIAAIPLIAAIAFYGVFTLHRQGIATTQDATAAGVESTAGSYVLSELFHGLHFTTRQALMAPVITIGILIIPLTWRRYKRSEKVAIGGLLAPLATLIFYRNTFPYYFVFLLAPVCVGISPSIAAMARRYGSMKLMIVVLATPLALLAAEPYGVLARQRALIAEVHRLFPRETGYLAYTGFVPDYPRVIPTLISGVGLDFYYRQGKPVIAEAIERGDVGFVLADNPIVRAAFAGKVVAHSLQPQDFAALHGNFIHYESKLWIAGKMLCPASGEQAFRTYRPGEHSLQGGSAIIDGRRVAEGSSIALQPGLHRLDYASGPCLRLWALPRVPHPLRPFPKGPLTTMF